MGVGKQRGFEVNLLRGYQLIDLMVEIKWKTVGIVGGFGPGATVDFYQRILDYCKRRVTGMRANTGYHRMIIYNCNFIPFDTSDETTKRANPELLSVTKRLEEAGADFIVIPSNTPHLFYDEIASSVSIPVLNIVEETAKAVNLKGIKKVGIIPAHPEVGKLYREFLAKYDIEAIHPDHYSQITPMIEDFMAGRNIDSAKKFFTGLMDDLESKGETTILACTELPLILGNNLEKYQFVDSTQVLAEATVERALTG